MKLSSLLKDAAKDPRGEIQRLELVDGLHLMTNGKSFAADKRPRTIAVWEAALQELESLLLIQAQSHRRHSFRVTREGYELAESG